MLFTSWEFFALTLITLVLYYLPIFRKYQLYLLIFSSIVFYTYTQGSLLIILILTITINALVTYKIYYSNVRKRWAILGIISNLSFLIFFKYSNFLYETILGKSDYLHKIPLPLGISFFTFQSISLAVDVYRSQNSGVASQNLNKNFFSHLLVNAVYISFFPKLISGPIIKGYDFLPQIKVKYFQEINWEYVFKTLVLGYFFKMVIADNLKDHTMWIAFPYFQGHSSLTLVTMLFGYSMQIFADFAGYSLIAIGISELFGYKLPKNFDFPYISESITEFWRRWHITLSGWLREYLYIPLGGNKKGRIQTYLNLIIVMVLGGFWHGAAWGYILWGTGHGCALALERFFRNQGISFKIRPLKILATFTFVSIGWLFFKLPNISQAGQYLVAIFNNVSTPSDSLIISNIILYSSPIILYHLIYLLNMKFLIQKIEAYLYGILLFLIILNSGDTNAFIYFQF